MLTTRVAQSSGKFTYSSPKNPCPVCGRTKDSDCRWDNELYHCRTHAKETLTRGEIIRGYDGRQWAYLGDSDGGRWALFKIHEEHRKDDWDPNLASFAKRSTSPPNSAPKPATAPGRPTVSPPLGKKARPIGQQEFIYHDAGGRPVIKVLRTDYDDGSKDIRQLRYENGEWIRGLNDQVTGVSKRVRLYRIAEARALSEKTGHPIFMVEGEKCVERLMDLGIPATTSIGGAGKWSGYGGLNYLQDLQGCRVVLAPDGDVPGLKHMRDIARSLRDHGIEIAGWLLAPPDAPWDNLPKSGGLDVVDWLESGATVEEILSSIRVALPDYLVADDETADLAAEVSELAQLDRASGLTLLPKDLDVPLRRIAERRGIPVEAYYLVLLCVAASLTPSQTRLVLDVDFKVPPILWGGLVGETGSGKSHIISTLTGPLGTLQAEHDIRYQHRLEEYKVALREYEKENRKSADAGDPPEKPVPVELYASDYTLEAVGQILSQQPERGILISPDELSAFLNSMDAYRKGKGADRARWLSLYNGQSLKINRKTSDRISVHCTSVSVIGGIQPSVLQTYWREDKNPGDGLWARFAWVKIPLVPRSRTRRGATHDPQPLLESVYRRLQAFPPMRHELDEEGWQLWDKWECEFDEPFLTEPNEQIRATLPKTKERAARIALVLHWLDAACDGVTPSKVIPASTLARAIEFTRWLQNQTRLIYGELGESSGPEVSLVLRFVGRFKGCGPISMKQCRNWWSGRRKPPMKEIRSFVDGVVQMGYARWVDPKHIEIIQPSSCSHLSHLVTQKPGTLMQSRFEQVTSHGHTGVTVSHSVATPAAGEPDRPEVVACAVEAEEQALSDPSGVTPAWSTPNNKTPQSVTAGDPTGTETVDPSPPAYSRPPVSNAASSPEVHNAGANGRRVRFLDRDPVSPPLRGREALLEHETYKTASVRIGGIRQQVPKTWLAEGSNTTTESFAQSHRQDEVHESRAVAMSGSRSPVTPTIEDRETEQSHISRSPTDDSTITNQDWNALLAACRNADLEWIPSLKFIADAIGIPVEKLDPLQMTQRQYQQAMRRVEEYRRSAEQERRRSEALEKIEDRWVER